MTGNAEAHSQEAATTIGKAEVDAVLACLRDLSSREMCDEVSVNFAFVSSKAARKRMVRALALLAMMLHLDACCSACTDARRQPVKWLRCAPSTLLITASV